MSQDEGYEFAVHLSLSGYWTILIVLSAVHLSRNTIRTRAFGWLVLYRKNADSMPKHQLINRSQSLPFYTDIKVMKFPFTFDRKPDTHYKMRSHLFSSLEVYHSALSALRCNRKCYPVYKHRLCYFCFDVCRILKIRGNSSQYSD
jgi:hypothetical protein